jgi:Pentapeptide repeats (8 copies)
MDSAQLQSRYRSGQRDFREALISGVNLVWVELQDIDLRGADLSYANLSGANLSGANLSAGTNLAFADLSRADLRQANLKDAHFEGANLEGVLLEGAVYDEYTQFPRGFNPLMAGATAAEAEGQEMSEAAEVPAEQIPSPSTDLEQFSAKSLSVQSVGATDLCKVVPPLDPVPADPIRSPSENSAHFAERSEAVWPLSELDVVSPSTVTKRETPKPLIPHTSDWHQVPQPDWPKTVGQKSEFYLANSSGQGRSSQIPVGIKGWNWGAFLLPWFWFIPNQVWIGLFLWPLSFLPGWKFLTVFLFAVTFGCKGNEWAWKARPWNSVDDFRRHQRYWAIAGFVALGILIATTLFLKS